MPNFESYWCYKSDCIFFKGQLDLVNTIEYMRWRRHGGGGGQGLSPYDLPGFFLGGGMWAKWWVMYVDDDNASIPLW